MYFTAEHEEAILKYCTSESHAEKEKLYTHISSWYDGNYNDIDHGMLIEIILALKNNLLDNNIQNIMSDLIDIIDDPMRLSVWCDSNLISSDINRMDAGEVFTPLSQLDDGFRPMDKIDPDYIHKDMKLLDLCGGRGNGAAYMYNMLYYNEKIMNDFPDDKDRKQHILTNMLYISEINPTNISILKDLFGENNENIIPGDAIGKNANGKGILSVKEPTKFKLYK